MARIWVYKDDGTLQCGLGQEIDLPTMRAELATIIGDQNILAGEKRQRPGMFPDVCGAATGRVNAYSLTRRGLWLLFHGFVGSMGFQVWNWPNPSDRDSENNPVPWPSWAFIEQDDSGTKGDAKATLNVIAALTSVRQNPMTLAEIVGRPVRCYATGDVLTEDYRPERVNIERSKQGIIVSIWFG
jgi:hypothetical protein